MTGEIDSSAMQHARYLAEGIGPRGSTTPQEAQAAQYAYQTLEEVGLQTIKEHFSSPTSAWRPYALASALALAAEVIFLFGGQVGAVVASMAMLFVLGSVFFEMTFQDNVLRWLLPKGQGQNVSAKIPAARQPSQCVIISGHLDTHRTPRVFSSTRWLRLFRWLVPVCIVALALNTLVFIAGALSPWGGWRSLAFLLGILVWDMSVLTFEADYTPFSPGAVDNATGAGIVLSLATQLMNRPLDYTDVWALNSGCEEVGCYGAADWLQRHRQDLAAYSKVYFLTLDGIGARGTQPCYIASHTFLTTARSDPDLLRLADAIAAQRPELGARKVSVWGAYTEGHIAAKAGLRILTLSTLDRDGLLPHWHQPSDVVANVDSAVVYDTETFVWELLHALDSEQQPLLSQEGG